MSGEPKYGEWQPIETAPKDGTRVLAYLPPVTFRKGNGYKKRHGRLLSVLWFDDPKPQKGSRLSDHSKKIIEKHGGYWATRPDGCKPCAGSPSHWMPLPEPPKTEGGAA